MPQSYQPPSKKSICTRVQWFVLGSIALYLLSRIVPTLWQRGGPYD